MGGTDGERDDGSRNDAAIDRPGSDGIADGTAPIGGPDALRAPDLGTDATAPARAEEFVGDPGSGDPMSVRGIGGVEPAGRAPRDAVSARGTEVTHCGRSSAEPGPEDSVSTPAFRTGEDLDSGSPSLLPALPPFPTVDEPASYAAVERWMAEDRAMHADAPAPRPYRVLPPTGPTPLAQPPAHRAAPELTTPELTTPDEPDDEDPYEDPQVRAWREEREFESQFGQWRAGGGAPPPMRRSTLVSPSVLILAFVLLVLIYYAVVA